MFIDERETRFRRRRRRRDVGARAINISPRWGEERACLTALANAEQLRMRNQRILSNIWMKDVGIVD